MTNEATNQATIEQRNDREAPKISNFDTKGLAVKRDTKYPTTNEITK